MIESELLNVAREAMANNEVFHPSDLLAEMDQVIGAIRLRSSLSTFDVVGELLSALVDPFQRRSWIEWADAL